MNNPTLFLVATPIGNLSEFTPRAIETLKNVDVIAAEDTRNSLKLLSHFDIHTRMIAYHNFNEEASSEGILQLLKDGKNVALISDAGYPLISDPGFELTKKVIDNGFNMTTVSGPNAGINALVSSGLDTTHYLYYGFLNQKPSQAKKELEALKDFPYTIIFYEAPHRIEKTVKLALEVFGDRRAVIARELTKLHETFYRGTLKQLSELTDLKGEIVFLVEGKNKEENTADLSVMIEEVKKLVDEGKKVKEACLSVSLKYSASKNVLYNEYIKNRT